MKPNYFIYISLLVCNRTILLIINRIVLTRWCYKKVAKKTLSNWYFVSILQNLISFDNSILSTWPYHTTFLALVPWCPHIPFCFWRIISNKSVKATYFSFYNVLIPSKKKGQYPCNEHCIKQTCDGFIGSCLFGYKDLSSSFVLYIF